MAFGSPKMSLVMGVRVFRGLLMDPVTWSFWKSMLCRKSTTVGIESLIREALSLAVLRLGVRRWLFSCIFKERLWIASFGVSSQRSSYLSWSHLRRIYKVNTISMNQLRGAIPCSILEGIPRPRASENIHPCIDMANRSRWRHTRSPW